MTWWNIAAREEGKYRAIGGHQARPRTNPNDGPLFHPVTGRALCSICGRPLTWREDKHAGGKKTR